jgi:hypothetical protein
MTVLTTGYFTVKAARNRGTKDNPHGGTLVKWYVDLLDEQGQPVKDATGKPADAYWQRKEGSEVNPGDKVYGEISQGDHGLRFKLKPAPDSGGGASTGTAGSKQWQPESKRDPERSARITRQHSQEMAVRVLAAMGSFEGKDATRIHELLNQWTNFFDADVDKAGKAASQGAGANASSSSREAPGRDPAPDSRPVEHKDEVQYFAHLIEQAGLKDERANRLATWVATRLDKEQRECAEAGLEKTNSAASTLADLVKAYEGSEGPLPVPVPDDDIPF